MTVSTPAARARRRKVAPRCTCPRCRAAGLGLIRPDGVFYCIIDHDYSAYADGQFIAANANQIAVTEALGVYRIDQAAAQTLEVAAAEADLSHDVQQAATDSDVVAALAPRCISCGDVATDTLCGQCEAAQADAIKYPGSAASAVETERVRLDAALDPDAALDDERGAYDSCSDDEIRSMVINSTMAGDYRTRQQNQNELDRRATNDTQTHALNQSMPQLPPAISYSAAHHGFMYAGAATAYNSYTDAALARDGR